ncbi:methylmalonyl-CoA mutase family protein [Kaistella antarctica]|uniref:Methylmalonyl-CoA mutase n=1 Tax=Kaistella antarctica TaxID=266748 RepID=A0A3S4YQG3_9FLAO|nr:methylmalonyl-CoA mutase family protein [Kaistella antarctica]KEY19725.1 methylmalonyl-CoA mutase [Kaistella antarctica]SEV98537.1 methylmalonyl-CoA mutase [Kaistella antarctica]VEH96639.1 Methylmalonyl-CoA mutase large subunit [Kaistella antarctica]
MFKKTSLQDWESVVRKQMKTENIYEILSKENLEGIVVKPYYDSVPKPLNNLPRVEESTHLVSLFHESAEENVFAFLLNNNVEDLQDKVLFVNNKDLAEHISLDENNRYISLIDVFSNDQDGDLNLQLAKELLAKNFERNLCVDVSLHQNSGATIIQQLAIALAKTKELTEVFESEILNKLIFKIAVGGNYFFEIAKVRSLKLVFNQLSKEFGLDEIPFIFAETSLRNKSKNDAENNLIRSTLELSAAMIGGADAVFSNDYKIENSNSVSEEISFKQQIVLAYESIINVFDDAGNGSYYVEDLTQQFSEKAWKLFLEMEDQGGYCELLKSGWIQQKIYEQAIKEQNWVEEGKVKIIGVNLYPKLDKTKSAEQLYSSDEIKAVRLAEMFE